MDFAFSFDLRHRSSDRIAGADALSFLAACRNAGLIEAHMAGTVDPGKCFRAEAPNALIARVGTLDNGMTLSAADRRPMREMTIDLFANRLACDLFFFEAFLAGQDAAFMDRPRSAFALIAELAREDWTVAYGGLGVRNARTALSDVPLIPVLLLQPALSDLLDSRAMKDAPQRAAGKLIAEATLPAPAVRRAFGDVLILDWSAGLAPADSGAVRERLARRARWVVETIGGVPDPNRNANGDFRHVAIDARPRPPLLTLYSASGGIGYKAVHSAMGAETIDSTLAQAAEWQAARRVDPDTPVTEIVVIADSRPGALALREAMRRHGIARAVYPVEADKLWELAIDGGLSQVDKFEKI
jgi:hypothetical protein